MINNQVREMKHGQMEQEMKFMEHYTLLMNLNMQSFFANNEIHGYGVYEWSDVLQRKLKLKQDELFERLNRVIINLQEIIKMIQNISLFGQIEEHRKEIWLEISNQVMELIIYLNNLQNMIYELMVKELNGQIQIKWNNYRIDKN